MAFSKLELVLYLLLIISFRSYFGELILYICVIRIVNMKMAIYQVQAVLLKFDTLQSLKNYKKSVYYNANPITLYFPLQFIKCQCTVNAKSVIKCLLKKERLPAKRQRYLNLLKRKYHENPEKKRQAMKKRYDDKKESIKHYIKEKYVENQT